ncbi:UDP-N-acetylglucosamine 1-carboxyvinyltransferase [Micrococcales bacterium 31B]|nr:UDP-N-acetylglucosamine 1-carboxyvinyltransferase [Micrococcales bacterium 31B]
MTTTESVLKVRGGKPLKGEITVRGAKNFVSKALVATLLGSEGESTLSNVPRIRDVGVVKRMLKLHGVTVTTNESKDVMTMNAQKVVNGEIKEIAQLAGASRIPILFCGPLLHRLGEAYIPDLGGCKIGDRPIDYHFGALRQFGAEIEKMEGAVRILAPDEGLKGAKIALEYPSVGTTEQVLLTAVLAKGVTELSNAAVEPEIIDLIAVLQKMGAIINVQTDRVIKIEGVDSLKGYNHTSLSDRIEAASWGCAALATGGDIFVRGADQLSMMAFLNVFRKIGGGFDIVEEGIRFYHPGGDLKSIAFETDVHPGFMTDWQQPLVVALTQAKGHSIVHETVYENRFGFTQALRDMGAQIQVYSDCLGSSACRFGARNFRHSAVINGPTQLKPKHIVVPDLRGGFSHLIAALAADGESLVEGIDLIDRGYENFGDKLEALGADVTYVQGSSSAGA